MPSATGKETRLNDLPALKVPHVHHLLCAAAAEVTSASAEADGLYGRGCRAGVGDQPLDQRSALVVDGDAPIIARGRQDRAVRMPSEAVDVRGVRLEGVERGGAARQVPDLDFCGG